MKKLILPLVIALLFINCDTDKKQKSEEKIPEKTTKTSDNPLVGAWELEGYYNYDNNVVVDSFDQRKGYRQVKIYTPTKVMWSKQVPSDSTEWFGYGSYIIENNQLKEILDYGSEMMTKIISEREEFKYDLIINHDTFIQIELDEDGNKIYSENYRRIE